MLSIILIFKFKVIQIQLIVYPQISILVFLKTFLLKSHEFRHNLKEISFFPKMNREDNLFLRSSSLRTYVATKCLDSLLVGAELLI